MYCHVHEMAFHFKMTFFQISIHFLAAVQGKFRQGYYYNPNLEEVVDHSLYIETDYDYIEEQKVYSDK
jgi:hypothetical protein